VRDLNSLDIAADSANYISSTVQSYRSWGREGKRRIERGREVVEKEKAKARNRVEKK
jgi:hypothetical protein